MSEYKLVTDTAQMLSGFAKWQAAIECVSRMDGDDYILPGADIGFRYLRPGTHIEFWIGDAQSASVQINVPTGPETENGLSAIAVDVQGRNYLVRQGILQRNRASGRIEPETFEARTDLEPQSVSRFGKPAARAWFMVTPLSEVSDSQIADNTANFVRKCWSARGFPGAFESGKEKARLEQLFGKPEQGGERTITVQIGDRTIQLKQGEVWQALSKALATAGIEIAKPRDQAGYEVDAEILTPSERFLLEIKTDCSAASMYGGVGQLLLYPQIIKRLMGHKKVLLIPGRPKEVLARAIEALGVELHSFTMTSTPDLLLQVTLSDSLLNMLIGKQRA